MSSSSLLYFLLIIIIFHLQGSKAKQILCKTLSCGDINISFPFTLKETNQDPLCIYHPNPIFQLSCNNKTQKLILNLPKTKTSLIIKNINYKTQTIQVNDPKNCLPKIYLGKKWNLSNTPFKLNLKIYKTYNLTFLSCPSNVTKSLSPSSLPLAPISRMSKDKEHDSVIVSSVTPIMSTCEVISRALVPLPRMDIPMWPMPFWPDLNRDVEFVWKEPWCGNDNVNQVELAPNSLIHHRSIFKVTIKTIRKLCGNCAVNGLDCRFSEDNVNQLDCSPSNEGISRSGKYGIAIGLLCLIGITCIMCRKIKRIPNHGRRTLNSNLPTMTISLELEPLPYFITGLDGATIERYPKTLIGESGRLLKPNDNTCSICLSEYQSKEMLRSMPECNHYFHAACIDEWLKMNGTCPICRNSLEACSSLGPSFTSLLLSPNS